MNLQAKTRLEATKLPNFPREFLEAMADEASNFISSNLSSGEERKEFGASSKRDQLEYGLNHDSFSPRVQRKYGKEFAQFTKLRLEDQISLVEPVFTKVSF